MPVNLRSLIEKLNDTVRSGLEAAAGLCVARTHYEVEIEHYLMKLLEATDSDFARIARHYGVDTSQLSKELTRSLDRMKRGNARGPALSQWLVRMLTEAWTIATLDFNAGQIRSGFTILALRTHDDLLRLVNEVSREFQKIQGEDLRKNFATIVAGSPEEAAAVAAAAPAAPARAAPGKTPNLDQYTIDLTERARAGKLDPVLGRDFEIRQIIDILMRRRQNNPILTGEAGVGKTAVVEGFAQRVVQGDVPAPLRNVSVRALDLALLQAGAGIKGEFENRLKGLIEEVKASPQPIILFIDEAHTLIGAGGQAGLSDAANLLKPALARGELRTIAATTWSEYKKYFEKDAALARRFQVVKVDEPGEEQCMVMLRGIVGALEKHHNVRILDEAVRAAVRLSHRYLAGRQLPDKAVSVLDTACARLALGQAATPPAIEDVQRRLDDLRVQKRVLEREAAVGADHAERLRAIESEIPALEERLRRLTERWERERNLVERIRELRAKLEAMAGAAPARVLAAAGGDGKAGVQEEVAGEAVTAPSDGAAALRAELESLSRELAELQGDEPLMQVCVDAQIVSEVISAWTGIPVGKMVKDELQTLLSLERVLGERIIGQDHALKVISERIVSSRASMDDPNKPVGVFLLVGPSGVGKTETALVLSDLLYGGERNLITINMSEFQEAHTVSTLKGAPPGYVGYGEGGVLTEAVRRRPYSVVLLDEVEKAHPDVLELFYQVFDKGVMEDGEGREIDFKNTIIMLTTNACSDAIMKLCADPETAPSPEALVRAIKPELNKIFKPAFLGRLVIVPYYPLRDEALRKIIELKLGKIQRRIRENHRIEFSYDPSLVEEVARRCTEVESGARNVDNILTNTLLPDISRQLLARMAEGEKLSSIHAGVGEDGAFTYRFA
ncbi:MAG: type VI secretion system ATPase TssH [Bryobacteraceae bacterium]|nr:type VI secretion system ATPase TssH [Bryobacteraceae bacterium]